MFFKLLIVAISLIFAGALGNIIDAVFYGVIFNTLHNTTASLFSNELYGKLFFGKVVDMLYFPIWNGDLPTWIPFYVGKPFIFFNAISTGVGILIVFNKKEFSKK